MCDADTDADNAGLSRRAFAIGASAASMAALLPSPADAKPVSGRQVTIATPDGKADAWDAPLRGNWGQLKKLKAKYPKLKVLISLGGWTYSRGFSEAARPENQIGRAHV